MVLEFIIIFLPTLAFNASTIPFLIVKMLADMLAIINAADDMRGELTGNSDPQTTPWLAALAAASDAVASGCPMLTEAFRCVCKYFRAHRSDSQVLARKGRHEELQVAARWVLPSCMF